MKSWREVYKVHPAADLFPMLPEDELRKLGEDIKANGLKENIVLWSPKTNGDFPSDYFLLDGRNRMDAMALVGILTSHGGIWLDVKKTDLFGSQGDLRLRHLEEYPAPSSHEGTASRFDCEGGEGAERFRKGCEVVQS